MRQIIAIPCEGETILATIDGPTDATSGWLFVTGGTQTRVGPHRLYERLAHRFGEAGQAVIRFDRRGVGDSTGDDPGHFGNGPDIAAALAALRAHAPGLTEITGFGLCDGATSLALFGRTAGIDWLALANPWVIEPRDDLPPAAAIRGYYRKRLTDPKAWAKLLTGGVNFGKLARGIARSGASEDDSLARKVVAGIAPGDTIILAEGDGTAQAFADAWSKLATTPAVETVRIATPSHSFAPPAAFAALAEALTRPR